MKPSADFRSLKANHSSNHLYTFLPESYRTAASKSPQKGEIQKKIEEVEPALEAAKSAVGAVNKQALDELGPQIQRPATSGHL